MNDCIVAGLERVPRDIDLVVGIPRSGMVPAAILALYLNVALTDVSGMLEGRILEAGISRRTNHLLNRVRDAKRILVIDDSCYSGSQISAVRKQIEISQIKATVIYGAVFAAPEAVRYVDLYFEICPMPRMFEWNLMHHPGLRDACLDIDGVLCCDPSEEENDDGEKYRRFLNEARPLWIPTVPVGWLVTSRLERYRTETEAWLRRYGILYGELEMLNLKSGAERRRLNCHARFKSDVYCSKPAHLFIESNSDQAAEIAKLSNKVAFCIANRRVYLPGQTVASHVKKSLPVRILKRSLRILKPVILGLAPKEP